MGILTETKKLNKKLKRIIELLEESNRHNKPWTTPDTPPYVPPYQPYPIPTEPIITWEKYYIYDDTVTGPKPQWSYTALADWEEDYNGDRL